MHDFTNCTIYFKAKCSNYIFCVLCFALIDIKWSCKVLIRKKRVICLSNNQFLQFWVNHILAEIKTSKYGISGLDLDKIHVKCIKIPWINASCQFGFRDRNQKNDTLNSTKHVNKTISKHSKRHSLHLCPLHTLMKMFVSTYSNPMMSGNIFPNASSQSFASLSVSSWWAPLTFWCARTQK